MGFFDSPCCEYNILIYPARFQLTSSCVSGFPLSLTAAATFPFVFSTMTFRYSIFDSSVSSNLEVDNPWQHVFTDETYSVRWNRQLVWQYHCRQGHSRFRCHGHSPLSLSFPDAIRNRTRPGTTLTSKLGVRMKRIKRFSKARSSWGAQPRSASSSIITWVAITLEGSYVKNEFLFRLRLGFFFFLRFFWLKCIWNVFV